jgi:hypothetical protein
MLKAGTNDQREEHVRMQKLIYIVWNLWTKRCRRVFDNKALAHGALPMVIKQDVQQWFMAWNQFQGLIGEPHFGAVT